MAISSLENNLTDVQYGHNKARWFLPFSVDNKLRYCHFNHLSCVFGGDFQKKEKDDRFKLSSRFAKLYWIQHLLTRTRTKQRRKPSRIAYLDLDTVITSPKSKIFPPSMANFSILMVKCSPLSTGECVESHAPTVDSRYQTGVIYLTNDQHSKQLFVDGVHSHMKTTNEVSSDQLFLNELLLTSAAAADNTNSNKNRSKNSKSLVELSISTVSKALYNAYPHIGRDSANIKAIWTKSGLPAGDEAASSHIVHFAGVYGAASIQNGDAHPLSALLIYSS